MKHNLKTNTKNFEIIYKNEKKTNRKFGDTEIDKQNFRQYKKPIQ